VTRRERFVLKKRGKSDNYLIGGKSGLMMDQWDALKYFSYITLANISIKIGKHFKRIGCLS